MSNRERRMDRAGWLMERDLQEVGADLRSARLSAGLTLRHVAASVGVVPSVILGHELGRAPWPRPDRLARHAAAVGMRARIRVYPEGPPLRDAAQVELLRSFRSRLKAGTRIELEVPVTQDPRDARAWDAMILLQDRRCAIECVTRFHDCQAQLRQFQLKLRDGNADLLIVVVKATHANRRALSAAADLVEVLLPLPARAMLRALQDGRDPGANGLVFL